MRTSPRYFLFITVFCMFVGSTQALELKGELVQGSLVTGKVAPGEAVQLNGKSVKVSENGVFVIGFGRDESDSAMLTVLRDGNVVEDRQLSIGKREYKIERIDGLKPSKVTPPAEVIERIRAESRRVKQARELNDSRLDFAEEFAWPLMGRISGVYGSRRVLNGVPKRPHFGVDIAAPIGKKVNAPASGIITMVHPDMYYSGLTIVLDHGFGVSSTFLHLNKSYVNEGDKVTKGQLIAEVGTTGRSSGPHLDWRMNWLDKRVDPALLVEPMPSQKK
jgi:murein DD-endopeptidase MepM/ murein hydrolase activator NlpD